MLAKDLLVVTPYRNRKKHLKRFLKKVPIFFDKQQITYDILICELDSFGDWNAGLCCNSLINFIKNKSYKYLFIHHVDIYPLNGELKFPKENEFFFNMGDYGSCLIRLDTFLKYGGYSNSFWGWGGEDNHLHNKLLKNNIIAIDGTEQNIIYDTTFQNHERKLNGKNYANSIRLVLNSSEDLIDNINDFYDNGTVKNIIKLKNNIFKQIISPKKKSPKEYKSDKVLITYIQNITDINVLIPFIKTSLLYSSYEYDIVICISGKKPNKQFLSELKGFGIIPYITKSFIQNLFLDRFQIYKKFLEEHPNYKKVLHTDALDVVFQQNPFIHIKDELIISSEEVKIFNQSWNSKTIKSIYGDFIYNKIKNNDVLCSGIIGGPYDKFLKFCNLIIEESKKYYFLNFYGMDQPIVQKLIYNDNFDIKILKHENLFCINLYVINEFSGMHKDILLHKNKVFYKKIPFSIIHQYNRLPDLCLNIQTHYLKNFIPI